MFKRKAKPTQKQKFMIGDKVAAFGVITSVYQSPLSEAILYTVTFEEYSRETLSEDKLQLVEDEA